MATEREQKAKELAIGVDDATVELVEARLDTARAQARLKRAEAAHGDALEKLRAFAATPTPEPTR